MPPRGLSLQNRRRGSARATHFPGGPSSCAATTGSSPHLLPSPVAREQGPPGALRPNRLRDAHCSLRCSGREPSGEPPLGRLEALQPPARSWTRALPGTPRPLGRMVWGSPLGRWGRVTAPAQHAHALGLGSLCGKQRRAPSRAPGHTRKAWGRRASSQTRAHQARPGRSRKDAAGSAHLRRPLASPSPRGREVPPRVGHHGPFEEPEGGALAQRVLIAG